MKSYTISTLVLALLATITAMAFYGLKPDPKLTIALQPSNPAALEKGKLIYAQHCASCHGRKLEGQPNWRQRDDEGYLPAPPHDASGHTWHHSDKQLFELTKFGLGDILKDENFKTRMPAYKDVLTDNQILTVLSYIKSQWPENIQSRHDKINAAHADK